MESLNEILDVGSRLMDNAKFEEALQHFSRGVELFPGDPRSYDLKGVTFFRLLKINEAIDEINHAIRCDPAFHLAYFHLCEIYLEQSAYETAENYCNQALHIEPENELYQLTNAFIKLQLGQNDLCIDICNRLMNIHPASLLALEYRASAFMNKKDFRSAVSDFETLRGNTRENSITLNNLGYCYSKIGDTVMSKKYLLWAIELDPGFSYPYDNLGYVYMLAGDLKRAHEYIDKSIELDPTNSYAFKNRGLVYLKQNDLVNAATALEKAKALRFDIYYGNEVEALLQEIKKDPDQ